MKDSLLDQAITFYTTASYYKDKQHTIVAQLDEISNKLSLAKADKSKLTLEQKNLEDKHLDFTQTLLAEKEKRRNTLQQLAIDIIALAEAEEFDETNRKSAQCLGTIQLTRITEGAKVAESNEKAKPVYKAILCLRLLDYMCINGTIADAYLASFLQGISKEQYQTFATDKPEAYQRFVKYVKVPIVMAALLQDIGNNHPDALTILRGKDGKQDPHRTLPVEERMELLQIGFRETMSYISDGIGIEKYKGNSREERDLFAEDQKRKLLFIKKLIKSSIKPEQGIGNLLKVPQIYTSIILSTKASYNYKVLPKVFSVLNQNAERKSCSQAIVDALYKIVGMFPQGFGVAYIPNEMDGSPSKFYEYAIVTQLYPKNPETPLCRIATRKLAFVGYGHDIEIPKDRNLYFVDTARKLANVSKARLNEILELLSSNYEERQKLDLLPRCWTTKDYFSQKTNQNLWNKRSS